MIDLASQKEVHGVADRYADYLQKLNPKLNSQRSICERLGLYSSELKVVEEDQSCNSEDSENFRESGDESVNEGQTFIVGKVRTLSYEFLNQVHSCK